MIKQYIKDETETKVEQPLHIPDLALAVSWH